MAARLRWVAGLAFVAATASSPGPPRAAPVYTLNSIVNAAAPDALCCAPNTLVTLYGQDLALAARAVEARSLPSTMDGVRVHLNALFAYLLYVSPRQVNFLVPPEMMPGQVELRVSMNGIAGPGIKVTLLTASPAFFALDEKFVIAIKADGSLITPQAPAKAGERVVVFGTGFGETTPRMSGGGMATAGWPVTGGGVECLLDGRKVEDGRVEYTGLTPGFAGLYQLNLRLPDDAGEDPEIRLRIDGKESPGKRFLPLRRENAVTSVLWRAFNRIGW